MHKRLVLISVPSWGARTLWLFVLLLTQLAFTSFAQNIIYTIEEFSLETGYDIGAIHDMTESENGLIWLGSDQGLLRYDGKEFKKWGQSDHPLVYSITSINQDSEGILWLYNAEESQYIFFDPVSESIVSRLDSFHEQLKSVIQSGNTISTKRYTGHRAADRSLIFDILDKGLLYKYSPRHDFTKIIMDKDFEKLLHVDKYIWLQSNQHNLVRCNLSGEVIDSVVLDDNIENLQVSTTGGRTFFSTFSGSAAMQKTFYEINDELDIIDTIRPAERFRRKFNDFTISFTRDQWIVRNSSNNPLLTLDDSDFKNDNLLLNRYTYEDSRKILWVFGHYGLVKLKVRESKFERILSSKDQPTKKLSIRGIASDSENYYLACEPVPGFVIVPKNNPSAWRSLPGTTWSRAVTTDSDSIVYFGASHLFRYNLRDKTVTKFDNQLDIGGKFFTPEEIWSIFPATNGDIWVGIGDKLAVKRAGSDSLVAHPASSDIRSENKPSCIYSIIQTSDNQVWLCASNGLFLFDLESEQITGMYNKSQEADAFLPAETFQNLWYDGKVYWLATRSGLIAWRGPLEPENYRVFSSRDHLSHEVVYAVYGDDYGKLWLSTDYGITSFDKEDYSTKTYLEADGIAHYEFNRISHFRDSAGFIYFGGVDGVTRFHPARFKSDSTESGNILLTGIELSDGREEKIINIRPEVMHTNTIHFKPVDRFFRLQFTVPAFDHSTNMLYAWKIDGIDHDWNYQVENQLQIGFLPYGKHVLRIKGKVKGRNWSANELRYNVIVHRPYYLQWWFIALCLTAITLAIMAFFRYRTRLLQKEIAKATHKIQQQTEELKGLDRLKSRFFMNVAHELRTPLTLISAPVNKVLANVDFRDENYRLLTFVKNSTDNLLQLVSEILDLSKLEFNHIEVNEEPVVFYNYLNTQLAQFHSFAQSTGINFQFHYKMEKGLAILIDKAKFKKIVYNFLSNAFKFTPEGGTVNLIAESMEKTILIHVVDSGPGIAAEDLPYIFERFYQSQKQDYHSSGGAGIGLSLAKELAELLGGSVWAKNRAGGSCFSFSFPMKVPDSEAEIIPHFPEVNDLNKNKFRRQRDIEASPVQSGNHPSGKNGKRIMIVEDNRDLRQFLLLILDDYELTAFKNGMEAYNSLQAMTPHEFPHLIISDLMMPEMDGMELLNKLKDSDILRHIPVVLLTAKDMSETRMDALRVGVDDCIIKPFHEPELLTRVANILKNYDRRMQLDSAEATAEGSRGEDEPRISAADLEWLKKLETLCVNHLDDNRLNVSFMASRVNVSNAQLFRKVKKLTGLTPNEYLKEIRMTKAYGLISSGKFTTIKEVSAEVGYSDPKYFSKLFRERFGSLPSSVFDR